MDFLHTLLSHITAAIATILIALSTLTGNIGIEEQKIVILPPAPLETKQLATTSSSHSIIGTPSSTIKIPNKKATVKISTESTSSTSTSAQTSIALLPPPSPTISAETLNIDTRATLVNILCTTVGAQGPHPISASGVFIDSRGVILTNAHVGQYFLLKDYPTKNNVDCTVRVGSPAQPRYRAALLYLPLPWIISNASQLVVEKAKGTGENDFAFLVITGSTGPEALPTTFPHLAMTGLEPNLGESMFLAAYPAGFLDGSTIEKNLYPTSAYATVNELYTFGTGRDIDLVSIGGTIVSQGGSSGGAVVRAQDGKLAGIIATATAANSTADRDLRAITLAHIERSLIAQGQKGLADLLLQDLTEAATRFASTTALEEKDLLVKALEKH